MTLSAEHRARLTATTLSEAQFTAVVAEIVRASIPGALVEVTGALELSIRVGGGVIRQFLFNAWSDCRDDPARRVEVVGDHIRGLADASTDETDLPAKSAIIPMIKDETWLEELNEQFGPQGRVAAEKLAADLWIVYGVNSPDSISYLADVDRESLLLGMPELRDLSLRNLRSILPEVQRHGEAPAFMLTAGGNFEASLLLVDEIWDPLEKLVEGDLVAAVPSRDVLVFTGSRSRDGLDALRGSIRRVHARDAYTLCECLIVRRKKRWMAFEPGR